MNDKNCFIAQPQARSLEEPQPEAVPLDGKPRRVVRKIALKAKPKAKAKRRPPTPKAAPRTAPVTEAVTEPGAKGVAP